MSATASCLLYSTSPEWTARVQGGLSGGVPVTPIAAPAKLDSEL